MNKFAKIMQNKSDNELLEIITKLKDDYQEEAVKAAEYEIKKRDLTLDKLEEIKMSLKKREKKIIDKQNAKLDLFQKILFFIFFWGIIPWGMAGTFKMKGYERKYKEAWKSMKLGLITYLILLILMFSLSKILE